MASWRCYGDLNWGSTCCLGCSLLGPAASPWWAWRTGMGERSFLRWSEGSVHYWSIDTGPPHLFPDKDRKPIKITIHCIMLLSGPEAYGGYHTLPSTQGRATRPCWPLPFFTSVRIFTIILETKKQREKAVWLHHSFPICPSTRPVAHSMRF